MKDALRFKLDRNGRILHIDPRTPQYFEHIDDESLIGLPLVDLIHPDGRESLREAIAKTADKRPSTVEGLILHHGETRRAVSLEFTPDPIQDGEGRELQCIIRPAFSDRSARSIMTRLATQLSAPIGDDFMNELIVQASAIMNLAGALIATVSEADMTTVTTQSYVLDGKLQANVCYNLAGTPCEKVIEGDTVIVVDDVQTAYPKDTLLREHGLRSYAGTPIRSRNGKTLGLLAVFGDEPLDDIDMIDSAVRILAARVSAEMDRRLVEQQLRHSQKMESLGQLAGGVAHDFNNLLTVIMSTVDLVRESPLDDRKQLDEDLGEIRAAAQSAAQLTRKLLSFSHRTAREPRVIAPGAVIESLMTMIGRLISDDIEVSYVPDHDLSNVRMDPSQLEQILLNLAINAADAMPNGGVLQIETRNVDLDAARADALLTPVEPGSYVMVRVTDTGMGIERKTLERIFDPFFTTKDKSQGTGLGLAMVHGVIEQCHAGISVSSSPGKGTTFEVFLPRVDADRSVVGEPLLRECVAPSGTVLVIEDEKALASALKRLFETAGYDVHVAHDGVGALELFELFEQFGDDIDAMVSDLIMPGMNGLELYEKVRAMKSPLPIVFMSGYTDADLESEVLSEPNVRFLDKPFRNEAMLEAVALALGQAETKAALLKTTRRRSHRPRSSPSSHS